MKKLCLYIALVLNSTLFYSQIVFCPAQAEWHYKVTSLVGPNIYNEQIKYVRDTVCFGVNAKVIAHQRTVNQCGAISNGITLVRESNDSVYFMNLLTVNNWQLLYNFGATVGQSWAINIQNADLSINTITVTVDSVNYKNINSYNLKYLKVTYKMPRMSDTIICPGTITERLGDEQFMFNFSIKESSTCGTWAINPLLCYQDSAFGLKQFTSLACNYTSTGIKEVDLAEQNALIYPNPSNGMFTIQTKEDAWLEIVNELGQIVKTVNLNNSNNHQLVVDGFTNGIYCIKNKLTGSIIQNKIMVVR